MSIEPVFIGFLFQHHCRRCGKLVCGTCSSNRVKLPRLGLSRVCDECFLSLGGTISRGKGSPVARRKAAARGSTHGSVVETEPEEGGATGGEIRLFSLPDKILVKVRSVCACARVRVWGLRH